MDGENLAICSIMYVYGGGAGNLKVKFVNLISDDR